MRLLQSRFFDPQALRRKNMIMQRPTDGDAPAKPDDLFPNNEGKTETLGLNLPPKIAAAIRRTGFRRSSISAELLNLIDPKKLHRLLRADAEHQAKCHPKPPDATSK
jgi:hypothetical protein